MAAPLAPKRPWPEDEADSRNTKSKFKQPLSDAAKFNAAALRKVQKALEEDPEIDIATALPSNYSDRLVRRKIVKGEHYIVLLLPAIN